MPKGQGPLYTVMKQSLQVLALVIVGVAGLALFWSTSSESPAPAPVSQIQGAPIDAPAPATTSTPKPGAFGIKQAPTDPAARAALAAEAPTPKLKAGYTPVTFNELSSFSYETDKDGKLLPTSVIPKAISKLDKSAVALSGFLVPIEFQEDKVSSLILVRNQLLCCYGEEPKLNEWVFVSVDPPVEAVTDVPVTLYGTFYATPDIEEDQVISLYRMEATEMERMDS